MVDQTKMSVNFNQMMQKRVAHSIAYASGVNYAIEFFLKARDDLPDYLITPPYIERSVGNVIKIKFYHECAEQFAQGVYQITGKLILENHASLQTNGEELGFNSANAFAHGEEVQIPAPASNNMDAAQRLANLNSFCWAFAAGAQKAMSKAIQEMSLQH